MKHNSKSADRVRVVYETSTYETVEYDDAISDFSHCPLELNTVNVQKLLQMPLGQRHLMSRRMCELKNSIHQLDNLGLGQQGVLAMKSISPYMHHYCSCLKHILSCQAKKGFASKLHSNTQGTQTGITINTRLSELKFCSFIFVMYKRLQTNKKLMNGKITLIHHIMPEKSQCMINSDKRKKHLEKLHYLAWTEFLLSRDSSPPC